MPVILLDHQPRNAHLAAARGVALQLSGHTHGGMVSGLARLVALANKGFVSGSYAVRDMHLYVSNGMERAMGIENMPLKPIIV